MFSPSRLDGVCDDKPAAVITATALICFHIRVTGKVDLSSLPRGVITANKTGVDIIFVLLDRAAPAGLS